MTPVEINAADGSGTFGGYLAMPEAIDGKTSCVIVIQEIFGVNDTMKHICEVYARLGYIALCPDLFWRQKPGVILTDKTQEEWNQAFAYMNGFDQNVGIDDLMATVDWLRKHPLSNGKVGCVGYCLGGRLAVMMACRTTIDASVSYYGVGLENFVDELKNLSHPLMVHVASEDQYATENMRNIFEPAFKTNELITYHLYKGMDHAFAREGGMHYDEPSATLANNRSYDFFQKYL